ncbi:MAG: cytochrome c oxidase assembly protein [Azospirillum brasilense]|nr:MAG: cytochrome c oxidase assembly protein [Azospirillum brasilense]
MHPRRVTVLPLVAIVLGMLMLSYAAVPFYNLFCRVTGFGGTTQRAEQAPATIADRRITVRFNADTDPALPWKFTPLEREISIRVGENRLVAFRASNESSKPTRGTATYNVTPHLAGKYFDKIQCFCFEEQRLNPGQTVNMPVSFFIDPAILDDPELKNLTNITLSYTFFSYDSANHSKLTPTGDPR